jgi:RNA polymerase sigma factor (sigma-70 family)
VAHGDSVVLTDEALLAGMAAGDVEAMAELVRRYEARVYGLALRLVADPGLAEEVAQDALMRAWTYASSYDPRRAGVAPWLLTITRNLAVDALRRRRDSPIDPERLIDLVTEADEPRYDGISRLRAELRALPADQARPIVLAVYLGLTAQQIAEEEGIPLGTAKTRIRRGLARLRRSWGANDG